MAGLVNGNYHYRKLPLPHDIFITATITGTLNFILTVTIKLMALTYRFNSQIPVSGFKLKLIN